MAISDDDLLSIARNEKSGSLGFEETGGELQRQRQIALKYSKGEMDDMPSLPQESSYVSSDVADAVEQVLPDLLEPFIGEEVFAFIAQNGQAEAAAQQETDYINQVIQRDNQGYRIFRNWFKDACLMKTGYVSAEWQEPDLEPPEHFEGQSHDQVLQALQQFGPRFSNLSPSLLDPQATEFEFDIAPPPKDGKCVITNWPPEQVAVSSDTKEDIGSGTWCALRSYLRRGELLAQGYDPDLVADLPRHSSTPTVTDLARDDAGQAVNGIGRDDGVENMDMVEVLHHFIRVYDPDINKMTLHRVVTGGDDVNILLKREEISRVPVASITCYPISHAHYGESVADKMISVQRVKSVLTRGALNNAYYAQSQRFAVGENGLSDNTLDDLINPAPGSPVRMADVNQIKALEAGALNYDPFAAIEYISTAAEKSTGILRSSMGLNPDTLHETASGMLSMQNSGQRRVRAMAQDFAQGGVMKLVLIVHAIVREHSTMPRLLAMRGTVVPVDPTTWGERDEMSVAVGVGANGRDHDIASLTKVIGMQTTATQLQGGPVGPLTNPSYMLYAFEKLVDRMGLKNPERYAPPAAGWQPPPPQPPKPDPEMVKVQGDLALNQQKATASAQLDAQRLQQEGAQAHARIAIENKRVDADAANRSREIDLTHQRELLAMQLETSRKADQAQAELGLKAREIDVDAQLSATELEQQRQHDETALILDAHNAEQDRQLKLAAQVRPGGEPG